MYADLTKNWLELQGNDGRDAFLVMSSAYYDRKCLKSAVDFERKIYFCLSRSSPPTPAVARANLHETHFLPQFTTLSIKCPLKYFIKL